MSVLVRQQVRPPWPFRLPPPGMDGLLRRHPGGGLRRLLHVEGRAVVVAVAQPAPDRVVLAARAQREADAETGIARLRFALGVDDDLAAFHDAFADDPVIGPSVRRAPEVRVRRRPDPWEALAWAVTEQLIDFDRAVEIQRRMIRALGRRCPYTGLRDAPTAPAVAATAPARLESFDLAPRRALALRRVAREVAAGRVDCAAEDGRRLLAMRDIGPWTVEVLLLHGQGRLDVVPAGDLGFRKLVGRLLTGRPAAVADIPDVRAWFARYGPWKGQAGEHLRHAAATGLIRWDGRRPVPAGTRSSAAPPRASA